MTLRATIFPDGFFYECESCGRCCRRNWQIAVEEEKIGPLEKFAASKGVEKPLVRHPVSKNVILNIGTTRGCQFLGADNLCSVHAELGAAAKPLMCRTFPVKPVLTPAGCYVRFSFACPAVRKNKGRPVAQYLSDVEEYVAAGAAAGEVEFPALFAPGISIDEKTCGEMNRKFILPLLSPDGFGAESFLGIWRMLWTAAAISEVKNGTAMTADVLEKASAAAAIRTPPSPPARAALNKKKMYYAVFAGYEFVGREERSVFVKMKNLLNLMRDAGRIDTKYGTIDLAAAAGVSFRPDESSRGLLSRYFSHVAESDWMLIKPKDTPWTPTVVNSWALLSLFYGLIAKFARIFAALDSRASVSREDIDRALDIVEIEYVSHISRSWLFLNRPVFAKIFEGLVSNPGFVPTILAGEQ